MQVLVLPLPPGVRKLDYSSVEQRLRTCRHQSTAEGRARGEENSGLNCMHLAGIYATAHTHFMTADSLYTDALLNLCFFSLFLHPP